ncbi:MAG: (2Fe-2S)-binding protein [Acidobacteria bacterium]|nr:(2Fe-2S)-binding protein [Acidobacteriota bacterium]MCA1640951.1 (2Fe-2S)-binding protein [Acidobacteriota bacterium]
MSTNHSTDYENFLDRQDETAWARALEEIAPAIHEVERNATRVWFAFFPLALARALQTSDDPEGLARKLLMQGNYRLEDQIDSSHKFLYGHRHWRAVKDATTERADSFANGATTLADEIRAVARRAAEGARVDESLLVGIAAVALMTVAQVGLAKFRASPGEVKVGGRFARQSPAQVLRERARDDSQGLMGFLRTTDKRWTVVWNENDESARFQMIDSQEIASAAPNDERDWSQIDPRCTVGEGPIPVQCRSASCGTCWVGVLGGAEKLSPVAERERKVMHLMGYIETDEPRPLIRLSCQAQGRGAVSVVVPPWNGVFGKFLRAQASGGDGGQAAESAATAGEGA